VERNPAPVPPEQVFTTVILDRIKVSVNAKMREEQAGFTRVKRSHPDQIMILVIINQSLELKSPLYIYFLEFKKTFDIDHKEDMDLQWPVNRV